MRFLRVEGGGGTRNYKNCRCAQVHGLVLDMPQTTVDTNKVVSE